MESSLRDWAHNAEGTYVPGDDNEVDARWLLCYTLAVDAGTRSWMFGWQLKNERRIKAKSRAAERRLEKSKRIHALREDGLNRLDSLVRGIGDRLTAQQGYQVKWAGPQDSRMNSSAFRTIRSGSSSALYLWEES